MNKLVMMVAACAAMVMGATAATPTITGAWLEGTSLGFTMNKSLGKFDGRSDEHIYIRVGNDYNGVISSGAASFFDPLAYSGEYISYAPWYQDWATVFEFYDAAEIVVCRYGDNGVDAETHYQIAKVGTMHKNADGVWYWYGTDGRSGIVGTEVPKQIVKTDPETKCPVLRFLKKISKR